jgi:Secretion system C-terminal sorting domain/Domain of unknown function (DUF4397)
MKKITGYLVLSMILLGINHAQSQFARVQVIHNSPDLAATVVDVYVNGNILLDDFKFRMATPFVDVPASVALTIEVKGNTSTATSPALYSVTTTLVSGSKYILVADGIVSATGYTPNKPFQISIYDQAHEVSTVSTKTDVLVHHGSPDAPTVDVNETSVPVVGLVNDVSYPNFAGYLDLATADYTLNITPASGSPVVATYSAPLATLALQGKAITVLASGFLDPSVNSNGPAFGLWVALNTGGALIPLPVVTLGVSSFSSKNIKLYPNPVNNVLNVNIPDNYSKAKIKITDLLGKEVMSSDNFVTTKIDVSKLSSGLYFINLGIDDKNYVQKFIKNN